MGSIAVEKFGGEGELHEGAGFTLYEKYFGPDRANSWREVIPLEPDKPPADPDKLNEKRTSAAAEGPFCVAAKNVDICPPLIYN